MGNWVVPPPPGQACCLQKPPAFLSHWGNLSYIQSLQLFRQGALPVPASPLTNTAGGDYLTAHHWPSLPPSHTPGPPPVHTCPQPTQLQTPNPPQHTALWLPSPLGFKYSWLRGLSPGPCADPRCTETRGAGGHIPTGIAGDRLTECSGSSNFRELRFQRALGGGGYPASQVNGTSRQFPRPPLDFVLGDPVTN